jgi:transposase-like protein
MIAEKPNQIVRQDERFYRVASQSFDKMYDVIRKEKTGAWLCTCPDHVYREVKCKHIFAVEFSARLRDHVEKNVVIQSLSPDLCLYCSSTEIVKHGLRHNQYGDLQRYSCRNCGKRFTKNLGFEGLKASPQAVTSAMQLYFSGESLRNTQRFLRLQGIEVSHQTIYNWIKRYVKLMEKYLEQIRPHVSGTWRADELYLKVHGNMKYLYAMMDDETRFWIAQEVGDTKLTADIRPLFRNARKIAGRQPSTLITDGAPNFHEACEKEYWNRIKTERPIHIQEIRLAGKVHNNKMERMNGELRDREKVMRSLKNADTPIIAGLQIYHNYIRPHMAPAEKAGITIEGENRWLTLIQNASHKRTESRVTHHVTARGC